MNSYARRQRYDSTLLQPTEPGVPGPPVTAPLAPTALPRPGFVRRHWGKGLAAILVVGFAAQIGGRSALGPSVAVVVAARRELVQKVVASRRVRGPSRIDLGSTVLGKAVKVTLEEGQTARYPGRSWSKRSRRAIARSASARAPRRRPRARWPAGATTPLRPPP